MSFQLQKEAEIQYLKFAYDMVPGTKFKNAVKYFPIVEIREAFFCPIEYTVEHTGTEIGWYRIILQMNPKCPLLYQG